MFGINLSCLIIHKHPIQALNFVWRKSTQFKLQPQYWPEKNHFSSTHSALFYILFNLNIQKNIPLPKTEEMFRILPTSNPLNAGKRPSPLQP